MDFGDFMIAAAFASAFTILALILFVYRTPPLQALRGLADGASRSRPWQWAAFAFGLALLFTLLNHDSYRHGYFFLLLVVGAAVAFTVAWVREFLFLMALRDEDLPGRFDKPIWAFTLLALPPVGLFLFRWHRLAHWPEPEPKPRVSPAARELA